MRRRRFEAHREEKFLDLQAENELLRLELRKSLALRDDPRPPRIPATYRRKAGTFRKHFVIPDTQVKPGVPMEHLTWAGKYIAEHAAAGDVIVHLGDHWDMSSLSSYDKGKKSFEGRRYKADVEAGNAALALLTKQLEGLKVERHLLRGNHEDRITRTIEAEPWLEGVVTLDDLESPGWHVHPFLDPLILDDVLYVHYVYNPRNGRPWGGMVPTVLKNVGRSFVQGHRQGLEVALQQLPTGERRRGVVAGSFYQHDEAYLGPQGDHWRGMLMLTEVQAGDFDLVEVSLDYLRRRYAR
jgi:hypothetical protein